MSRTAPEEGLLESGLHSAMLKNQELRDEINRLKQNMDDAVHLIGVLNSKIAILSTLTKHGTSPNPITKNE